MRRVSRRTGEADLKLIVLSNRSLISSMRSWDRFGALGGSLGLVGIFGILNFYTIKNVEISRSC